MSENLIETDIQAEISPVRTYCGQFSEVEFKISIFKQYYSTNLSILAFKLAVPTKNQNASFSILYRHIKLNKIPKNVIKLLYLQRLSTLRK